MNRRTVLATIGIGSMTAGCLRLESGSDPNTPSTDASIELSIEESFDIDTEDMWYDGTNYYYSGGNSVGALIPGEIRWEQEVENISGGRAFATKDSTTIFGFKPPNAGAGEGAAEFRAYNSAAGDPLWQYRAPEDGVHTHPRGAAIVGGTVAVGSNRYGSDFDANPLITGIDAESGSVQWETELGSIGAKYLSGLWVYDDLICVGQAGSGVALLDPATGDIEKHYDSLRTSTTGSTVEGDRFFAASNGALTTYDLSDGSENWIGGIEGRSRIEPLIDSTLAIVGTGSGGVFAFDRASGTLQWDGSVGGQVNAITSSNDHIWATSEEGGLVGFTRGDGNVIHRSARDIQDMVYGDDRLVFGADETHIATLS